MICDRLLQVLVSTERMASEPKHRKTVPLTQPVSSENEETSSSQNEESSSDETTSTTCKFIC